MISGKKIAIIMPAYNAAKKIEGVFSQMPSEILDLIDHFYIVQDGSKDDTEAKALAIKEKYKKVTVLVHPVNKGYGAAQKTGFSAALGSDAQVFIVLHSDGQTDPALIPSLSEPILSGAADMVLGSRMIGVTLFNTAMPKYKYLGNKGLTLIENLAFGTHFHEFHTGYIAYSRKALETIDFTKLDDRFHFDGNMIVMAIVHKLVITEVKVPIIYDDEESHLHAFSYARDVLRTIWRYKTGYYHKLK